MGGDHHERGDPPLCRCYLRSGTVCNDIDAGMPKIPPDIKTSHILTTQGCAVLAKHTWAPLVVPGAYSTVVTSVETSRVVIRDLYAQCTTPAGLAAIAVLAL